MTSTRWIVYDNTTTPARAAFAGIVRRPDELEGGATKQVTADGTDVTLYGVDVFGLLAGRVVYPDPSTVEPWGSSHDVRTGVGSTVAAGFITDNAGTGALTARQIANLSVVDAGVGSSSTWSGRLQRLDRLVARIGRESGFVLRTSMPAPGEFVFTLTSPVDRSSSIIFTDQGDLEEVAKLVTPAVATHILAAGQGELTDRLFASADSGAVGLARVEAVYENTNITTAAGMVSAAQAELEEREGEGGTGRWLGCSASTSTRR